MTQAMIKLNIHIGGFANDERIRKPSQLVVMEDDIFHFYFDGGLIEEPNIENEEAAKEYTVVEAPLLAYPQPMPGNTPRLGQFLKFPVERVSM